MKQSMAARMFSIRHDIVLAKPLLHIIIKFDYYRFAIFFRD